MTDEIILLRGLFREKGHWGNFPALLQSMLPHKTIRCLDIAGVGERVKETSPSSIEGMVENLRAQLNNKNKISIVAMSMGGMIGIKWLELYANEIDKLICINTSSKNFSAFYQRLRVKNYLKILFALFSSSYHREKAIFFMTSNSVLNKEIIQNWMKLNEKNSPHTANFFRQLLAAIRFEAKKTQNDVYFISSVRDQLVSHKATRAIADAWNMPLIINYQDGHDIALDNPKWLSEVLLALLEERPLHCS